MPAARSTSAQDNSTSASKMQPICHIVTPLGNMGYGFDEALIHYELTQLVATGVPTAIILDSGSTDSGPQKLALGSMTCTRSGYYKDLSQLLRLVHTFRVPLIFSSAGGDGADEHVKLMEEIIEEIAAEEGNEHYHIKAISIYSGIDKTTILNRLKDGRITGCGTCVPPLTPKDVELSPRVVAQVGPEPFLDAMEAHPDYNVIIGGRAYDPAPYIAYALHQLKVHAGGRMSEADIAKRMGGFAHMGKIMECGGHCAKPKSHGAVATVYADGLFDVRPTAPDAFCSPQTVAAHTLYENARPDVLAGPGGALLLHDARYEQLADGRTVRVSGSRYRSHGADRQPYRIKLEAARVTGYRSIFMGGMKDPILIPQLDNVIKVIRKYVAQQNPDVPGEWKLDFHVYGRDKPQTQQDGHPGGIFVIAEVVAPTQELATSICCSARAGMIHAPYVGQKATAGNLGFGIGGKLEIEMGECTEFSVYHLMDLEPGEEHLAFGDDEYATEWGGLLRATVQIIGTGHPTPPNPEFIQSIALLQKKLPKPTGTNVHSSAASHKPQTRSIAQPPRTLSDLCVVMRSKNAGPYEITLDAIFESEATYRMVRDSNLLTPANVARALGIARENVVWMGWYEPALAFKVTIPRVRGGKRTASGGFMENDVHGSQEHLGLATMELPMSMVPLPARVLGTHEWATFAAVLAAVGTVGAASVARRLLFNKK